VLAPQVVVSYLVFPSMDDGWLTLLVLERGFGSVEAAIRHRPLFIALLRGFWTLEAGIHWSGVIVNLLTWLATGYLTARLWNFLFPEAKRGAPLAACLAVAPIVVMTQLTTLTTVLPINIPVLVCYLAVLLLLEWARDGRHGAWVLFAAPVLVGASQLLSEYAFASALAGIVLFLWIAAEHPGVVRSRCRSSIALLIVSFVAGTLVFRFTADFSTRPDASGSALLSEVLDRGILDNATWVVTTIWRVLFGAPAAALGEIRFIWGEKSTMAAVAWGCVVAWALTFTARRPAKAYTSTEPTSPSWRKPVALLMALSASLIAEFWRQGLFFAGKYMAVEAYSTRFCVPAIPLAACVTVWVISSAFRERWWWLPAVLIGLMCGHAAFRMSYTEFRNERIYPALGRALEPYVRESEGITIAVLPDHYGREYTVVVKIARDWQPAVRAKLWALWDGRVGTYFKQRADRSSTCALNRSMSMKGSGIVREGPISQMLWVVPQADGQLYIEPYCVGSQPLPATRTGP
jgi:hypothetical protein